MKSVMAILAFSTLMGLAATPAPAAEQVHRGQGTVNSIDTKAGTVKLAHGAIPSLNWPAMTMDFAVADKQALTKLKPGQKVEFKVVEKTKGRFVISEIAPSK